MDLKTKLKDLSDEDANKYLANVLKGYKDTEAHQALAIFLARLQSGYEAVLYTPDTPGDTRAFVAGAIGVTKALQTILDVAFTYDSDAKEIAPDLDSDSEEDAAMVAADKDMVY